MAMRHKSAENKGHLDYYGVTIPQNIFTEENTNVSDQWRIQGWGGVGGGCVFVGGGGASHTPFISWYS